MCHAPSPDAVCGMRNEFPERGWQLSGDYGKIVFTTKHEKSIPRKGIEHAGFCQARHMRWESCGVAARVGELFCRAYM